LQEYKKENRLTLRLGAGKVLDSTRLLMKRTLAFLGREELLEALEARRNKR